MTAELAVRDDAGLIDLVEARALIEQAGRDGDVEQLREWHGRINALWTNSREEANKAGEVKARIEREIGLIDFHQYGMGSTNKKRPPFPVADMPKWLQTHCRRLASATQEEFDRVIAELWSDPHREICTSAFRVLKVGDQRARMRELRQMRVARWREMRQSGLTATEIAERDGVSSRTVYNHLAPSEERKHAENRRKQQWRETQRLRKEKVRLDEMAARSDARGKAYMLVDQQVLRLIDEASKQAATNGEREECNAAYGLALKLRDALYRASVESELDEWTAKAGARRVHGRLRGGAK